MTPDEHLFRLLEMRLRQRPGGPMMLRNPDGVAAVIRIRDLLARVAELEAEADK